MRSLFLPKQKTFLRDRLASEYTEYTSDFGLDRVPTLLFFCLVNLQFSFGRISFKLCFEQSVLTRGWTYFRHLSKFTKDVF